MSAAGKKAIAKWVISCELAGFAAVIVLIWLDEVIDIPALFLGGEETPINWRESLFESVIVALLCAAMIRMTNRLFQQMKCLEGMLPICASCKKIRGTDEQWHCIESYIVERSDNTAFSHGICPECAEKLYPEHNPYKKK